MGYALLQLRGDTAAAWTSANPVLAEREIALETDTGQFKIGDGATAWTSLGYGGIVGPEGPQGPQGPEGPEGDPGAAATIAVGTVTTGAAGSSATVTNVGTSSAAVFDFTIPAGAVGVATVVADSGTTYTVLAADASVYRRMTATTAKTVTVGPESGEALPANYEQHFDNDGAGTITFVAGSGVTIKPPADGSLIVPQNGVVTLKRLAANTFRLIGITEAP